MSPEEGKREAGLPLVVWVAGAILVLAACWGLVKVPRAVRGAGTPAGLIHIQSKAEFYDRLKSQKGKVVLVNFWATWCGPCRMEIPSFIETQDRLRKNLVIMAVSLDQNPEEVLPDFVQKMGMNFPIFYGPYDLVQSLGSDFGGVQGIPTSILIDRQGRVAKAPHVGVYPAEELEADLKVLLDRG